MAATTTFSGWAYFVTLTAARILGLPFLWTTILTLKFYRFPIVGPAKRSKVNNIVLGIWTRKHLWINESILSTCKLGNGISKFPVFFLQFFRCFYVSVRTNVGRTVKSSPNAESTVGKFLKWFTAALAVSPFSLSYSICLANFALYREHPLCVRVIYF